MFNTIQNWINTKLLYTWLTEYYEAVNKNFRDQYIY